MGVFGGLGGEMSREKDQKKRSQLNKKRVEPKEHSGVVEKKRRMKKSIRLPDGS